MLIANLPHVSLFSFYVRKTCTEESESDYNFETTLKCCDKVKTKQEKKRLEAATRGVLCKKLFLEISQNSLENTRARVSFLIKLPA